VYKQTEWQDGRSYFNCVLSVFDIYHGTAPQYLLELVWHCDDTHFWSSVLDNFVVSRAPLHVTDKAFSIAEPRTCIALPSNIRLISSRTSCRKKLKDTLFQCRIVNFLVVNTLLFCV